LSNGFGKTHAVTELLSLGDGEEIEGVLVKRRDLVMQAVQELQSAVSQLSADELARFREWFDEFDAKVWDKQFEEDVKSGKLDQLADQAISDFRAGKCKEL